MSSQNKGALGLRMQVHVQTCKKPILKFKNPVFGNRNFSVFSFKRRFKLEIVREKNLGPIFTKNIIMPSFDLNKYKFSR